MLRMLMQETIERKKQTEETVSALSSGPKPPPPPGGSITSATQGLQPGSSRDDDAPMTVAPEILSNFAKSLMHHVKPFLSMEHWADERKKNAPRNLSKILEDASKRRGSGVKTLSKFYRSEEFTRKRLPIEEQNVAFKHKIEQQPDPPPVSGGESSAPDHVHDLGEKKQIKIDKRKPTKAPEVKSVIKKPKHRPRSVVQGKVVQGKVVQPRLVQGRSAGQLPSQYRGLTRA